jgi:hypothetical protein
MASPNSAGVRSAAECLRDGVGGSIIKNRATVRARPCVRG